LRVDWNLENASRSGKEWTAWAMGPRFVNDLIRISYMARIASDLCKAQKGNGSRLRRKEIRALFKKSFRANHFREYQEI